MGPAHVRRGGELSEPLRHDAPLQDNAAEVYVPAERPFGGRAQSGAAYGGCPRHMHARAVYVSSHTDSYRFAFVNVFLGFLKNNSRSCISFAVSLSDFSS